MNLNQLRYFISVASYRSFSKAAECHFMTQTAITQQIRALEESIGLQLINRQKRPIALTPAGRIYYQEAQAILARVEEAARKAREASTGTVGAIRIGYEKGYERSNLSDRLRSFHRAYPNILFSCIRADSDTLAEKLLADELDVIFAWDSTNIRANENIRSRLDIKARLFAVLYSAHPLAGRASLRRQELRNETLLFMTPSREGNSFGDAHFLRLYENAGYKPNILLTSNDVESILIMAAAEEGISIVPSYAVSKLNNADNLVFVPMEGPEEYEEVYILSKNASSNAALACFLDGMDRQANV